MKIKLWLRAMRVPFFTATVIPVLFGYLLAWHDTSIFVWPLFILTLFGAVCMHAGTNMANDYFDHRSGCDEANKTPTPFSGGSRVIQEGLISPGKMFYAFSACFILGSVIGLYLNYVRGGNVILILGVIGVFLGIFYTAKPFRIGYGSFGEIATGIGFGPLMVMGAYYVGAGVLPFKMFPVSIPIGILIALVLFINEFPDYAGDLAVGKRTLVVVLGKKRAIMLYQWMLAVTYAVIAWLVAVKYLPYPCLAAFLSVPIALKAFSVSKNNYELVYELLPANAATIGLHSVIGLLLCAGVIIDKVVLLWR